MMRNRTFNNFSNGNGYKNEILRPYEPLILSLMHLLDAILGMVLFIRIGFSFTDNAEFVVSSGLIILIVAIFIFQAVGLYHSWRFSNLGQEFSRIIFGCLLVYSTCLFLSYFLGSTIYYSRSMILIWMLTWPVLLFLYRIPLRLTLRYYRRKGINTRKAVIVGMGPAGSHLINLIKANPWSGTQLAGYFDDIESADHGTLSCLGKIAALAKYVIKNRIDYVYITLSMKNSQQILQLQKELSDSTASIYFIPDLFFLDMFVGGKLLFFDGYPVIALQDTPIKGINALLKRIEDLILGTLILIISLPLWIVIPICIRLTSKGPVIFKQYRYGLNGDTILIYKFRTMTVTEDGYHFQQAQKNDRRVTRVGMLLRSTSLDELPQIINVIQGRMSIVGPRPHPVAMNEEYRKLVPGYMLRHKVKPGITGLAQVNGFRGETDTLEKMELRIKYDLEYLQKWSIFYDLKIIIKTVFSGVLWKNAY